MLDSESIKRKNPFRSSTNTLNSSASESSDAGSEISAKGEGNASTHERPKKGQIFEMVVGFFQPGFPRGGLLIRTISILIHREPGCRRKVFVTGAFGMGFSLNYPKGVILKLLKNAMRSFIP
jgi:hypothetical protein